MTATPKLTLDQLKDAITRLTYHEKVELLHAVSRDLTGFIPGIEKTPGVCGGAACIRSTRISVYGLVEYRQLGMSDAAILEAYPSLTSEDLVNAWEYARLRPEEIEQAIRENNEA